MRFRVLALIAALFTSPSAAQDRDAPRPLRVVIHN
jgi:hypothetical protein